MFRNDIENIYTFLIMTRYQFLKSVGFTGGSLMALLSCVKNEDTYVEALTQNPDGTTSTAGSSTTTNTGSTTGSSTSGTGTSTSGTSSSTSGSTGSTTTSATGADKSLFITTTELNKITGVKATIDLNASTYTKLKTMGGYVVIDNTYVLALSKTGKYIAATVTCSHEPKKRIIYSNEEWYCTDHGARFSLTGTGLNQKANRGLTIYKVATDGNTVVIY